MKIAMLTSCDVTSSVGGVQGHVYNLSKELSKMGHEIAVCSPMSDHAAAQETWSAFGTKLLPIYRFSLKINFNQSDANVNFNLIGLFRLLRKLREDGYEIIHIHEPIQPVLGMATVLYSPLATVGTWHSYIDKIGIADWPIWGYNVLTRPGNGFFKNWAEKQLNVKIAVSRHAEETARRYIPGEYVIVPNGVESELFETEHPCPPHYDKDFFNILFVGRINSLRKGLNTLLGAYSLLKYKHPKIRVVVVGSGELEPRAQRTVSERGLDDIIYAGKVDRQKLAAYYQHADLFCAPNTGRESFGMVLIEALTAGVPTVAAKLGSFEEVGGDCVEYFTPKDEFELADRIEQIYLNPTLREEMRTKGLERAKQFNWTLIAAQIEKLYSVAIERYKKSPKCTAA